jgi:hypothetical protein
MIPAVRRPARSRSTVAVVLAAVLVAAAVTVGGGPSRAGAESRAAGRPAVGPTDAPSWITRLSGEVSTAQARAAQARARRDQLAVQLAEVRAREESARARTDALSLASVAAARKAEASKARLQELAVAAYRQGGSSPGLSALLDAKDVGEYAYRSELVRRVGHQQRTVIDAAKRDAVAAKAAADAAREERDSLARRLADLERAVPTAEQTARDADAAASDARRWLSVWQGISGGAAGTAILGRPALTGDELVRWFDASGRHARVTVPFADLASYYVDEGAAEGVRGDIAFAQSILETGGFSFPDRGMVRSTDNNFAGIGACDSCKTGHHFPDARTGVRAQVQWLRAYADRTTTNARLAHPPADCCFDTFFLRGKVTTWGGLTGTWATASGYGDRILDLYREMLAWLTRRAGH